MNSDLEPYVIYAGGPCKAMPGNKVAGRIVTFSSSHDPDRVGEFFTAATDFWLSGNGERRPFLYRQGCDPTIKKRRFGEVQITRAADGLWVTGTLNSRDSHSQKMMAMAEQGELNWSTGATGHLCDTTPVGNAKHIDSWPIAEVSLAPLDYVCEPRNILSLKSLIMDDIPTFDDLVIRDRHHEDLQRRAKAITQDYWNYVGKREAERYMRIAGITRL